MSKKCFKRGKKRSFKMSKKMKHLFKEVADMFVFFPINFFSALIAEFSHKMVPAIFAGKGFLHGRLWLTV
jgi:hypothetical protein